MRTIGRGGRSASGRASLAALSAACVVLLLTVRGVWGVAGPVDCNDNGVPDDQDIAEGTSQDCNNNGIPDECDIENGSSDDCNENGVPDACDVAFGTSEDCNGNEVPDECETLADCNGNMVPDQCDIASGFSEDCNENGLPDECESDCNDNGIPDDCDVDSGFSEDCNGNSVPDVCDIAFGSPDCNLNGVPDQCELAGGGGSDCNGNGILDECDINDETSTDCNANFIPDECESGDCNGNGILDLCDIFEGMSEDCNGNLIPDDCEVLFLSDESPALGPIGFGAPQTYTIVGAPPAGSDVTMTFSVVGDFGALIETVDVELNGVPIGTLFVTGASDCPPAPDTEAIVIERALYNSIVGGGNAGIEMIASDAVDPAPKLCSTVISVLVEYQAVTANDVNGNGIPDACECREDLDGSGTVGFTDLIAVLSAWGACPGCPEDFDGTGEVGFIDLITLLSAWGPCR